MAAPNCLPKPNKTTDSLIMNCLIPGEFTLRSSFKSRCSGLTDTRHGVLCRACPHYFPGVRRVISPDDVSHPDF